MGPLYECFPGVTGQRDPAKRPAHGIRNEIRLSLTLAFLDQERGEMMLGGLEYDVRAPLVHQPAELYSTRFGIDDSGVAANVLGTGIQAVLDGRYVWLDHSTSSLRLLYHLPNRRTSCQRKATK